MQGRLAPSGLDTVEDLRMKCKIEGTEMAARGGSAGDLVGGVRLTLHSTRVSDRLKINEILRS